MHNAIYLFPSLKLATTVQDRRFADCRLDAGGGIEATGVLSDQADGFL